MGNSKNLLFNMLEYTSRKNWSKTVMPGHPEVKSGFLNSRIDPGKNLDPKDRLSGVQGKGAARATRLPSAAETPEKKPCFARWVTTVRRGS